MSNASAMSATLSKADDAVVLETWLSSRKTLIWMQPDGLLAHFETSVQGEDKGDARLPSFAQGAIFIWDRERFARMGYGDHRLAFLFDALWHLSVDLGDDFLLIDVGTSGSQDTLMALLSLGVKLHSQSSPATEDLESITTSLMMSPTIGGQVVWRRAQNWITYPKKLPAGFFGFWKHAERALFPSNSAKTNANPGRPHRAHRPPKAGP